MECSLASALLRKAPESKTSGALRRESRIQDWRLYVAHNVLLATSSVLLHIPHASTLIPAEWMPQFVLSELALTTEILKVTDWYSDELYQLEGAERLVFPVSRLLVDPERFAEDVLEVMASRGLGAVYTRTQSGQPLKSEECRSQLMEQFYYPHHDALDRWAMRSLETNGRGLIIDCHSYPSSPLPCDLDQTPERPDFCIGTCSFHTPIEVTEAALAKLRAIGFTVTVDLPYAGTIVPAQHYQQEQAITSIMIEVNRALYMDEATGERLDNFVEVHGVIGELLSEVHGAWQSMVSIKGNCDSS